MVARPRRNPILAGRRPRLQSGKTMGPCRLGNEDQHRAKLRYNVCAGRHRPIDKNLPAGRLDPTSSECSCG